MAGEQISDGGPAFPTPDCSQWDGAMRTYGMSLRDYFAGIALQGLLAADGLSGIHEKEHHGSVIRGPRWHEPESIANTAFELADAMLAERNRS